MSWRILLADLVSACEQARAGAAPELPRVGTSMRTWAHELARLAAAPERVAELRWWREALTPADPILGARRFDPDRDMTAEQLSVRIPASVTHRLLGPASGAVPGDPGGRGAVCDGDGCRRVGSLGRWPCECRRLRGGTRTRGAHSPRCGPLANRGLVHHELPVRIDLTGIDLGDAYAAGDSAGAALAAVKEQWRAVPDHGIGYGLLRYLNPDTATAFDDLEDPQVSINYLGRLAGQGAAGWSLDADGPDTMVDAASQGPVPSTLAIDAYVVDLADGPHLCAAVRYAPGVLDADGAEEFAALWRSAVHALAEYADRPGSGGLTPSDLDLVTATQQDIARWERASHVGGRVAVDAAAGGPALPRVARRTRRRRLPRATGARPRRRSRSVRLAVAAQALMDRHPSLRTAFDNRADGTIVQVVLDHVDVDWSVAVVADCHDQALIDRERENHFDMRTAPLIRFLLVELGAGRRRLVVTNHHILLDGWSMPLLVSDLFELYVTGGRPLARPAAPYRDYLTWLVARDTESAQQAWAGALTGCPDPPSSRRTPPAAAVGDCERGRSGGRCDCGGVDADGRAGRRHGQHRAAGGVGNPARGDDHRNRRRVRHHGVRTPARRRGSGVDGGAVHQHRPGPGPARPARDDARSAGPVAVRARRTDAARALGAHRDPGRGGLRWTLRHRDGARVVSAGRDGTESARGRDGCPRHSCRGIRLHPLPALADGVRRRGLRLRLRYAPQAVPAETVTDLAARLSRIVATVAHRSDTLVGRIDVLGGRTP